MKPQWQQQQQQMRRQQEQMRQRQMAAAWMEQQKKKEQAQAQAMTPVGDRFSLVEQAAEKIRQQVAAGKLSQEQAKAQMKEMMVQDDAGIWWTVGFETGSWYKFSDDSWVAAQPQRIIAPSPTPHALTTPVKPHRFQAFIVLIIGLALTAGIGFLAGQTVYDMFDVGDTASLVVAAVLWLIGLRATIKKTRKLWRGL
jgi:hypothetical protein